MAECIFCRILAGELPASVVYRDERVLALMDITPVIGGHVLVVPVRHATYLADLDPEDGAQIFRVGQQIAAAMRQPPGAQGVLCEGVNFWLCDGRAAGQEVMHVHLHVIPRYRGDGFGLRLPSGYGQQPSRARLDEQASALRGRLDG